MEGLAWPTVGWQHLPLNWISRIREITQNFTWNGCWCHVSGATCENPGSEHLELRVDFSLNISTADGFKWGHTFVAMTMLNPTSRELKDLLLVTWMQPSNACLFLESIQSSPFYLTHMFIPPYSNFIQDFTQSMLPFPTWGRLMGTFFFFYSKQISVRGENKK